eukprot:c25193_g1_i1 orf=3-941(-)
MAEERRVHPSCINASNPYHECVEYCFRRIVEAQERAEAGVDKTDCKGYSVSLQDQVDTIEGDRPLTTDGEEIDPDDSKIATCRKQDGGTVEQDDGEYAGLTPMQKKMFDLRLKLNSARKANQAEIIAEKNREEAPKDSRGVSKQKWFEERKKRLGKQLESNGLDMSKVYMLDTQEAAEAKYKHWEKKPAPFGWDVFNQRSLYNAHKRRTENIPYTMDDYMKAKETDPDFYRDGSSLEYGKAFGIPEENIDKMVNELEDRNRKRKQFSRRRRFHEEKDVDSINDRNEHFNRKIERAFGRYTVEIKNNLERGTAL